MPWTSMLMMFNSNSFERYFFHHWVWLNMFMWYIYCITNTEQTSENIYHICLWHSNCSNLAEDGHFGTWCMWCAWSFFIVYKNLLAKFIHVFPFWGDGEVLPPSKHLLIHPLPTKFLFPPTKSQFNPIKK